MISITGATVLPISTTPNIITDESEATNWADGLQRCCLKKKVENMTTEAKQGRISGPEDCGNLSIYLY